MEVIAVIPARGGSKGIPRKNLAEVGGRSLITRAVTACRAASSIDRVIVTTDDDAIAADAERAGASIVRRPGDLATDEAGSEAAVLHALDALGLSAGVDDLGGSAVVVFVQCTSPFLDLASLDRAVRRVVAGEADVVFSAVPTHEFVWRRSDHGVVGANHESDRRERRQDRPAEFRETGAFYVMRGDGFVENRFRFFGRVEVEEVRRGTELEIDEPADLDEARRLSAAMDASNPIGPIDALVTDFDGVHTDNTVWVDEHGVESVRANRSDGLGLAELRRRGVEVLVLSTEVNPVVLRRAEKLGVQCINGCDDKAGALERWLSEHGIGADRTAYVGNDRNDAACLEMVGWPIVVADAHPSVRPLGRVVTARPGGHGAVREVVDRITQEIEQRTDRTLRSTTCTEVLHG